MRIIAGRFGSRRIEAPKGMDTRPTLDQTRESMFNVLQGEAEGARVLDLFAGSGALGLEALSRGAVWAVFCDTGREAVKVLRANIAALGVGHETCVLAEDCFAALDRLTSEEERFDLIFLDPPYPRDREYVLCLEALGADPKPLVIVQHASKFTHHLKETYGKLKRVRILSQGDNSLSFYEPR